MDPFLKGIITGLVLSLYVGATFFMLVETSITRGLKAALLFDLGIFLSDVFCVLLVYFFASEILNTVMNNLYVGLFGGVAFIGFGVNYMMDRQKPQYGQLSAKYAVRLLFSGFIINILNPSVFVFWLGTLAVAITHFHFTGKDIFLYLASTLFIVVCVDVLKIYSACWLRRLLTPRVKKGLCFFSGAILILFGIVVIISKIRTF
ncbi:MAG: LysE family transporter [Bacteroidales bacterium]|nr:LysE family transporter [Bacteroidales bacterium]